MKRLALALLILGCSDKQPPEPTRESASPAHKPPPGPVAPQIEPPSVAQPSSGFTGFSTDGKRFAWVAPGRADIYFLKVISVGEDQPKGKPIFEDAESQKELKARLAEFSPTRTPAPADLKLTGDITTTPPVLSVERGGKSVKVPLGEYPFPPTDAAEIWGVSADGKHVAIHIAGKDVPGMLSKGEGKDFHFFFVATVP
jgi:hypothetical protein